MVAIRAALNMQHGGVKDFYICSLSSRFVPQKYDDLVSGTVLSVPIACKYNC